MSRTDKKQMCIALGYRKSSSEIEIRLQGNLSSFCFFRDILDYTAMKNI